MDAPLRPPQPPFAGGKTSKRIKALMKLSAGSPIIASKRPRSRSSNRPPGSRATSPGAARHTAQTTGKDSRDVSIPPRHSSRSIPSPSPSPYYPGTLIPVPSSSRPPPPHINPQQPALARVEAVGGDPQESTGSKPPISDTEPCQYIYTAYKPTQIRGCRITDHTQDTKSPRKPLRIQRAPAGHRGKVSTSHLEDVAEEDTGEVSFTGSATSGDMVLEPAGHGSFDRREYIRGAESRVSQETVRSCDRVVSRRGSVLELGPRSTLSSKSAGKCVSRNLDPRC